MITPILIVFPDVAVAQQGLAALMDLRDQDLLALYGSAILIKDADGRVSLQSADEGPFGLTVGGLVGAIAGLPAGPVGLAIGAASGSTLGAIKEMVHEQGREGFLLRAFGQVPPGWSAVAAEVTEFGDVRLAARMAALGGLVLHDAGSEAESQAAYLDLRETRAVIGEAWSDYEVAVAQAAAAREARLDAARTRLAGAAPRLKLLEACMQAQLAARIAQLQQQAEQAGEERRTALECQIAQLRGDHDLRRARLEDAWNQVESAFAR